LDYTKYIRRSSQISRFRNRPQDYYEKKKTSLTNERGPENRSPIDLVGDHNAIAQHDTVAEYHTIAQQVAVAKHNAVA
jgi:hypothetical protein